MPSYCGQRLLDYKWHIVVRVQRCALSRARHQRARMWRWDKQVYQSLLKHTVKGGKHPTVFMPQVTKTIFLINQPINHIVLEQADLFISDKNLILCISRSLDLAPGMRRVCSLTGANWGCFGDLFCQSCLVSQSQ